MQRRQLHGCTNGEPSSLQRAKGLQQQRGHGETAIVEGRRDSDGGVGGAGKAGVCANGTAEGAVVAGGPRDGSGNLRQGRGAASPTTRWRTAIVEGRRDSDGGVGGAGKAGVCANGTAKGAVVAGGPRDGSGNLRQGRGAASPTTRWRTAIVEGRGAVAQLMAGSDRCSLFSRLSACLRTIFEQTSGFPNFCMRLCSLQLSGGARRWQRRRGGGGAGGARRDGGAVVERRAGLCCGGAAWSLALFFVWFYGCFVVWGFNFSSLSECWVSSQAGGRVTWIWL